MIDLKGKVVLVTGGSRGIGAATVRTLGKAGADVILHYVRSPDEAEAIAESVGRSRCHVVRADLASLNAATALWDEAIAWRGQIDVLVNNAGIIQAASVDDELDIWASAWQQTLQVNLVAVADPCRDAISR